MPILCVLFGLVAASAASAAGPPEAARVVRLLEARYSGVKTLRAVFLERYLENGRQVRAESGKVSFWRPGKMRWEYEVPETKLFVSDGHAIWFYVPADRTALRSSARESSDWRTPFLLLTKKPRVSSLCQQVTLGGAEEALIPGNRVLHCQPRGAKAAAALPRRADAARVLSRHAEEELLLEVDPATGDLSRVLIRQGGGVGLEFRFSNWERNPHLADSQFVFHPPPGVAIVEGQPTD